MRSSCIPAGCVVEGSLRGAGDLVVRGTVEGPITLDGTLTIEAEALVRGEVRARSVIVKGTLEGPAHASELVRLEAGGRLLGDVFAERMSAASGALVRGRVRMAGTERLRRTVGGTLEAPFSSAGFLAAAAAPVGAAFSAAADDDPPSVELVPIRAYPTTPASARSPSMRTKVTAPAPPRQTASQPAGSERAGPRVSPRSAVSTLAPEPSLEIDRAPEPQPPSSPRAASGAAPPPPVLPKLGRVRARHKGAP